MALSKTLISGWGTLGGGWLISHNVTSSHFLFMCMYGWEREKNKILKNMHSYHPLQVQIRRNVNVIVRSGTCH